MMDEGKNQILLDVANRIAIAVEARERPVTLRRDLCAIGKSHDVSVDVVWNKEPLQDQIDYQGIVRFSDGSTLSIGYSPAEALPWPVRGVSLASEATLALVNGEPLEMKDAVGCLEFWKEKSTLRRLLEFRVIKTEFEKRGKDPTEEQIQRALDGFRRARGLHDAAETRDWMRTHGLDEGDLLELARGHACVNAVKEAVCDSEEGVDREAQFDRWLEWELKRACVEWKWGRVSDTAGVTAFAP